MKKLKRITNNPLISGSIIIFSGTFLANVFNAVFNFFAVGHLSVVDYGIVASLISLISLPAYAANSIIPAVVQFGGKYFASNNLAAVVRLYRKAGIFVLFIAVVIFLFFLVFIQQISEFLKIYDLTLLLLTSVIIFVGFFTYLNLGMLQAKLAFVSISAFSLIGSLTKLTLGALFIILAFEVRGVMSAILLSTVIPLFLSLIPLKFIFSKHINKTGTETSTKELIYYGTPSAIGLISLTSLITSDILLVKHFFNGDIAGLYGGLSLAGRVIFYFTAPIVTVMFPLIVRKKNNNENYNTTFALAVFLVLIASLFITVIYMLIPNFVILTLLNKKEYLSISSQLVLFAINITLYSVISVFVNFYLSIKATRIFIPVSIAAIIQIVLICYFHNSFYEIIYITIIVLIVLLIALLLYYPYATKKK